MDGFITREQVSEAVEYIKTISNIDPKIGLILGSGLGSLADQISSAGIIPVADIPHWPKPTVLGHFGRLIIGQLENKPVIALQGRIHFYEGYSAQKITLPAKVMIALGIDTLILTNAAGGMNPSFKPGDLMLIRDHINFPGMAGHNPLRGPNDESVGPRFPDMTQPYDPELRTLAHKIALENQFQLQEGVYVYVAGPSFETPAEIRFMHRVGGDAVGMSTVPSVIVARHAGVRVLGVSTITNMALPDPKPGTHQNHEEVLEIGRTVIPKLATLIRGVVAG